MQGSTEQKNAAREEEKNHAKVETNAAKEKEEKTAKEAKSAAKEKRELLWPRKN